MSVQLLFAVLFGSPDDARKPQAVGAARVGCAAVYCLAAVAVPAAMLFCWAEAGK